MKLCRYDDDRLGVVRGDLVHDVTEAQTEIRKSASYAMRGDAVDRRSAAMARADRTHGGQGARQADRAGEAPLRRWRARPSSPARRPTTRRISTKWQAAAAKPGSQIVAHQSPKILDAGMFLKSNSSLVGPSEGIAAPLPGPPQRPRGRTGHGDRQGRQRHSAGEGARPRGLLLPRPRHHRARPRGQKLSQIGRRLRRRRPVDGDGRRDPRPRRAAAHAHRQRRGAAEQQYQRPDLQLPPADRIRLVVLHALSGRFALYWHAGRRRPGEARRRHRLPLRSGAWRA